MSENNRYMREYVVLLKLLLSLKLIGPFLEILVRPMEIILSPLWELSNLNCISHVLSMLSG